MKKKPKKTKRAPATKAASPRRAPMGVGVPSLPFAIPYQYAVYAAPYDSGYVSSSLQVLRIGKRYAAVGQIPPPSPGPG